AAATLVSGSLELDRAGRRLRLNGQVLEPTPKAVALLDYLMAYPGEIHSREHLLASVWGYEYMVTTRAVDHRVAELRRVLADDPQDPRWIATVPGRGYRSCAPVTHA